MFIARAKRLCHLRENPVHACIAKRVLSRVYVVNGSNWPSSVLLLYVRFFFSPSSVCARGKTTL